MKKGRQLSLYLDQPVRIAPLVIFRILFGALVAGSTIRFVALGWVEAHYITPVFHFKYYGFHWINVLPECWMYIIHGLLILSAIAVMVGFYYRIAAIMLFVTFTYLHLVDLTYYLNHYYFVTLISGIMIFLPANRRFSMDVRRRPSLYSAVVPAWTIRIIQFQVAAVYIFAGIAKINADWLFAALPMKIWLPAKSDTPLLGSLLSMPWVAYAFSWIGMLYDCTIALWLSVGATRLIAYLSVIIFHLLTGILFQIGIFPLVMVAVTLIFFSGEFHERALQYLEKVFHSPRGLKNRYDCKNTSPVVRGLILSFVIIQILLPCRFLFYPGSLNWTEQGYRFSWRVMLMEKTGTATFYVTDGKTDREGVVDNRKFLTPYQENQMSTQPDLIAQYARMLKDYYMKSGVEVTNVRAEIFVTLNGRPSQLLVDPTVDLATVPDNLMPKDWILPYGK